MTWMEVKPPGFTEIIMRTELFGPIVGVGWKCPLPEPGWSLLGLTWSCVNPSDTRGAMWRGGSSCG